jgi:GNAT superfamily N-acetyltransferase
MIELRDAQFEDYPSIAKLHADNWKRHYRGIYTAEFLDKEVDNNRLNLWYNRLKEPTSNQQIIIAVLDERIVGLSGFYLAEDSVFGSYLDNLHVAHSIQGFGIGKRLLRETAKRILDKADSQKMYLWVFKLNEDARRVYDRLGGENFETAEKQIEDGSKAQVCRYVWQDVSILL